MSPRRTEPRVPLVLIVDDDLTTVMILEHLLRSAGLDTLRAGDLATGDALFHTEPVTLVLLDVHLPDGNGLDLCRKLTATSSVPILFISGDSDIVTKTRGFASGGVDYITKPLSGPEVLARVRTHLRLHAAQQELIELHAAQIAQLSAAQQTLMPQAADHPEAQFEVCIRQAQQAGGDFYTVVPLGNWVADYIVADASGHDLGTSLWTAAFKTLLNESISAVDMPQQTCRSINDSLRRVLPESAYFTAIYARIERTAKRLTLVNAGHPSAILLSAATGEARLLEQAGDILGVFADASFGVMEVSIRTGDRLYLYTDGLVEMPGNRTQGYAQIVQACQHTAQHPLAASVNHIVTTMCGNHDPADDIVLLGIEV